jgi:two-component system phosphate regulon sensor histidine kinase PhoR
MFSLSTIKDFYIDTLALDLENLGKSLKFKVLPYLESQRQQELDSFVKQFGADINTRITVIDLEGVVLADSDEDPSRMNNHKFRPEIAAAYRGRIGRSLRFSNTVGADMLYIGLPVERDGDITEVLRVSLYVRDINRLYSRLRTNILGAIFILSLLSLAGAFFFARTLSKPIKEMSTASDKIASGDFNTRVFLKNRDELKNLAVSMNSMAEQMQDLFGEMSRQKEELNRILSSIADGLMAIDKEGKILFCNKIFQEIFQFEYPEGKFYWEAIRDREFNDFIKEVQQKRKNDTKEISRNGKLFLCRAILLTSQEEIVVSIHDLTEMRRVEQIKKDFISNVSHELRTPLTAIKGFVETLRDEADENCQNYVEIIDRHTNRLTNIVKDLLLLAELEEGETRLEYELVDLNEMIQSMLKIFDQKISQKKLSIHIHSDPNLPVIQADKFKLEQMLINILDNAVKYTEKGKIELSVKKESEEFISIEIQDTGIGIPKDQLPRVFERFYVVDKSRSRKLGGTGLGLSIVKHIALLHGGKITVESTLGEGTKFKISLALKPPQ